MNILSEILQKPPKAVFLDLDNTLYEYEKAHKAGMNAVYAKLLNMFTVDESKLESIFKQARNEIKAQLKETASSHSRLLYFQRMLELLGMKTQSLHSLDLEQTYWRSYFRKAELFEGVKSFLYELRSHQVQTVIITDLTAQIQFRKLIHFNIDSLIDYVVTSEEAGVEKPHKDIFELALKKVHCDAKDVIMIGDSYEKDIVGAENLGIKALFKINNSEIPLRNNNFESFKLS